MKLYQRLILPLSALTIMGCNLENNVENDYSKPNQQSLEARTEEHHKIESQMNEYYEKARNNFKAGNISKAEGFINEAKVFAIKNNYPLRPFRGEEILRSVIKELYDSAEYNFSLGRTKKGDMQIQEAEKLAKRYDINSSSANANTIVMKGIKALYEAAQKENNPRDSGRYVREAERLQKKYNIEF